MQKIGSSTPTANDSGEFTEGNPGAGVEPTWLTAAWHNSVQRELISVVQGGGLALDPHDDAQMLSAIRNIIRNGQESFAVDSGQANTYVCDFVPVLTARQESRPLRFKVKNTNTGACTINDGLGPVALLGRAHAGLQGGELVANGDAWVSWNASVGTGAYILLFCTGASEQVALATQSQHALPLGQASSLFAPPPGEMKWFATMTPPTGFLSADGSAVSRTTYAGLFNAITARPTGNVTSGSNSISSVASPSSMWVGMPISGTGIPAGTTITAVGASTITLSANATATNAGVTLAICPFGVGDGSATFNLPDGRGKAPRGWDQGASLDAGRVFGSYQADQFPSHGHPFGSTAVAQSGSGTTVLQPGNGVSSYTGAAGTGSETRMKNLALLSCIKY
ncbi:MULTISPECIES: tail fiber protein [Pseudomonas]|uniref:tail fiber protein n=1 Tax=Pseudomonas TaxID=286 RepID=UPI0011237CD3|nr:MULTISPECIES: tail fiber protein [Pseudomonas]